MGWEWRKWVLKALIEDDSQALEVALRSDGADINDRKAHYCSRGRHRTDINDRKDTN